MEDCSAQRKPHSLNEVHTRLRGAQTRQRGPDSSKVNICSINVVSHPMEAVGQRCGFLPDGERGCRRLISNQEPACCSPAEGFAFLPALLSRRMLKMKEAEQRCKDEVPASPLLPCLLGFFPTLLLPPAPSLLCTTVAGCRRPPHAQPHGVSSWPLQRAKKLAARKEIPLPRGKGLVQCVMPFSTLVQGFGLG